MRFLTPAAFFTSALLASAVASAQAIPTASTVVAPPLTPPPAAPAIAAPAYVPPYVLYSPPGAPRPLWMPAPPRMERNSDAMRTTGKLLFAAGGALTIVGSVMLGSVMTAHCFINGSEPIASPEPGPRSESLGERVSSSRQALNGCDSSPAPAVGVMVAGALTAVVGVPLFVIGSKQVPARTMTGKLTPELRVGAANASLRWSF